MTPPCSAKWSMSLTVKTPFWETADRISGRRFASEPLTNNTWHARNSPICLNRLISKERPCAVLFLTAWSNAPPNGSSPNTPITIGASADVKLSPGHSINWVKLYKYAALREYSGAFATCANAGASPKTKNIPGATSQTQRQAPSIHANTARNAAAEEPANCSRKRPGAESGRYPDKSPGGGAVAGGLRS